MRKLWVSVSGGRTSMYMAIKLKQDYSDLYELKFIFANTGLEHENTLKFLHASDKKHHLDLVWVEGVVQTERGKSTRHKVVNHESACRDGKVFEDMIGVYGIPNTAYPHCNRELKINTMKSYIASIGWKHEPTAIGIRADEPLRVPDNAGYERKVYPLVDWFPTDKDDVLSYFSGSNVDLNLPEHMGNCVTCWKKTDSKILRLINDVPQEFNFFRRMEDIHGLSGCNKDGNPRKFFRGHRSVDDMFQLKEKLPELDFGSYDSCSNEECGMV